MIDFGIRAPAPGDTLTFEFLFAARWGSFKWCGFCPTIRGHHHLSEGDAVGEPVHGAGDTAAGLATFRNCCCSRLDSGMAWTHTMETLAINPCAGKLSRRFRLRGGGGGTGEPPDTALTNRCAPAQGPQEPGDNAFCKSKAISKTEWFYHSVSAILKPSVGEHSRRRWPLATAFHAQVGAGERASDQVGGTIRSRMITTRVHLERWCQHSHRC